MAECKKIRGLYEGASPPTPVPSPPPAGEFVDPLDELLSLQSAADASSLAKQVLSPAHAHATDDALLHADASVQKAVVLEAMGQLFSPVIVSAMLAKADPQAPPVEASGVEELLRLQGEAEKAPSLRHVNVSSLVSKWLGQKGENAAIPAVALAMDAVWGQAQASRMKSALRWPLC